MVDFFKERINDLTSKRTATDNNRNNLLGQIQQRESYLASLDSQINDYMLQKDGLDANSENYEQQMKEIEQQLSSLQNKKTPVDKEVIEMNIQSEKLAEEISKYDEGINRFIEMQKEDENTRDTMKFDDYQERNVYYAKEKLGEAKQERKEAKEELKLAKKSNNYSEIESAKEKYKKADLKVAKAKCDLSIECATDGEIHSVKDIKKEARNIFYALTSLPSQIKLDKARKN